jgi:hypothetical protein
MMGFEASLNYKALPPAPAVDVKMATREEAYEYWGRVIGGLGEMAREMQATWRFDELRVRKVPRN